MEDEGSSQDNRENRERNVYNTKYDVWRSAAIA